MTSDDRPVLVVGATGNLGGGALAALHGRDIPVRAAVTDVAAWQDRHPDIEAVRLDLLDPTTFPAAVAGAVGVFLVRPPAIARVGPTLNALVDAAVAAGVGHVVFVSVAGADTNRVVPHHRVERHVAASPIGHTILRPGFFAQNLGDAYRGDIRDDDRLYLPAGDAGVAFVDVRDIGEVAAIVLADPAEHDGRGHHLTGPRAVTLAHVAEVLTEVLGRPIAYEPATVAGYVAHLRGRGLPLIQVAVQTVLHVGLRRGDAQQVTPTLGDLLDRSPRTIEDYVTDHRHLWVAEPRPDPDLELLEDTMTDTTPAVERMQPPDVLWTHLVNPVMRLVLRSPAHGLLAGQLMLLEYHGRRSGDRYSIPVGHRRIDGELVVLTNAGWRVNFRDGHPLQVRTGDDVRTGTGRLVEDPDVVAATYGKLIEELGWQRAGRRLGIRINIDRAPTHDELVEAVRTHGLSVLRIDLDD